MEQQVPIVVAALAGEFEGSGTGSYPTIEPFSYKETVVFEPLPGKPVLRYTQRTTSADGTKPMHTECGFIKLFPDGYCELTVAQVTGIAEVEKGTWRTTDAGVFRIDLASGHEATDATAGIVRGERNSAPHVRAVVRRFVLAGAVLEYTLLMATTTTTAMTHHLQCHMEKKK